MQQTTDMFTTFVEMYYCSSAIEIERSATNATNLCTVIMLAAAKAGTDCKRVKNVYGPQ